MNYWRNFFYQALVSIALPFFIFFLICTASYGKNTQNHGFIYYKNYSYLEYDHHPQNWCICQDKNGIIYVGNRGGILVFDGVSWQIVIVPNLLVRSMSTAPDGRIYVGGNNELGFLEPDLNGFLKYSSLTKLIKKNPKPLSNVWNTIATQKGVYFRTSHLLLRWNYKSFDLCKKEKLKALFLCENTPWIQSPESGLLNLENNSLPLFPGERDNVGDVGDVEDAGIRTDSLQTAIDKSKIWMMVPFGSTGVGEPQRFLLGTRSKGFLIYDGISLTPFKTKADSYIKKNRISHGIRLTTGDYAVATLSGGLVILDPQGEIQYIFNKSTGLQDNNVKFVFEDSAGNLWLALSNGVSRLEYRSPFYHYDDSAGLDGIPLSVTRHKRTLFTGTTQGLFALRAGTDSFVPVAGPGSCRDLVSAGHSLLAAASDGVYRVDSLEGNPFRLIKNSSYKLAVSRRFPGHIWCASSNGLAALVMNNNRPAVYRFKDIAVPLRDAVEDPAGVVWLYTAAGNILEVNFPGDFHHPVTSRHSLPAELHGNGIHRMSILHGHVVFASPKGLFQFHKQRDAFISDPVLGPAFAYGPDAKPVFRLIRDADNHIWFHSESVNYRAFPGPGGLPVIENGPFRRIPTFQMNAIFPDAECDCVWFAGIEGLTRFDKKRFVNWDTKFPALIRHVSVNETSALSGGFLPDKSIYTPPVLPYRDRNISFRCAAPFFEREKDSLYRFRLDGYDGNWSEWTPESRKQYTNLDAGPYAFHVQAKNIYGVISREDSFKFEVLPPWYLTGWAFSLYVLAFVLLFFLAVKWRSRKLMREKKKLERVVIKRTLQVREQNAKLEKQTILLTEQSRKLKELDSVKSRFFANISHEFRTPLTLIMSPLEHLLSVSRNKKWLTLFQVMLRNSQRLLTLINQLLALSRIDSGKMKLHVHFQDILPLLKGEIASFEILAAQQQLTLDFQCDEKELRLYFDAEKIEAVMVNLLGNAFKCTAPGGKITVSLSVTAALSDASGGPCAGSVKGELNPPRVTGPLEPRYCFAREDAIGSYVRVSVKDTGVGIPVEQLGSVFDRFFQGGNNRYDGTGAGIGLALAKEIIALHHGNIEVFSVDGEGTEFVFRLPIWIEHPDRIASAQSNVEPLQLRLRASHKDNMDVLAVDIAGDDFESDTASGNNKPPGDDPGDAAEKTVILVVEDHKDMRHHIRSALEPLYSVIDAANGKDGIAKAKEFIPDLIISDIMMPEPDGYQLCGLLKKDFATCHIPIILLTAKASQENVLHGLDTGADDYVTKPFNAPMLLARIKNLIQLRLQLQLKIQRERMLLPSAITVSSRDDRFLADFQAAVEKNLDDDELNVEKLCELLFISRNTLFKKLKALTGESPNQFIQSYRLERGAQLLKENYGNVTEVAFSVGFSSSQYFARCFKEKFHQSPKSYQASHMKTP
ncbi:MAG: response regulator [bacterium]|nr:response regulator [bacterium]